MIDDVLLEGVKRRGELRGDYADPVAALYRYRENARYMPATQA